MSTVEIKIENLGVNKNKGQGWNAWIRAEDKTYYSKFCQDEEEGKAAIGSLQPGDAILLKYSVKNGFNNFQSYQSNSLDSPTDKKTEKQEAEKKQTEQKQPTTIPERENNSRKSLEKEEDAVQRLIDEHYKEAINSARTLVDSVMQRDDPAYPAVLAVIVDRLATPKVYLERGIRKKV